MPARTLYEKLTAREHEILMLIAAGHSNQEIADQLVVALSTVKWYARQIFNKLGVDNRRQAIARAREAGLLLGDQRVAQVEDAQVDQFFKVNEGLVVDARAPQVEDLEARQRAEDDERIAAHVDSALQAQLLNARQPLGVGGIGEVADEGVLVGPRKRQRANAPGVGLVEFDIRAKQPPDRDFPVGLLKLL